MYMLENRGRGLGRQYPSLTRPIAMSTYNKDQRKYIV